MKLVIIAGGKGTRLGLKDMPKPMVEVGGKPLLEHQINLAKQYAIKNIYILSGHLSDVIVDYFGDGRKFGVNISHMIEKYPLGTAGAVKQLEDKIRDRFMVFYGDVFLDINLRSFMDFDREAGSMADIIVHPNDHPYDSDLVEIDDGNVVTAFHSKPHDENQYYRNLVNAAVYILGPDIFECIPQDKPSDFGKDIFPMILQSDKVIRAYKTAEYIKDIGTIERLGKVSRDIMNGKVKRFSKRYKRPAIFIDRDGTIVMDVDLLHRVEDLELLPFSAAAIKKINDSDYLSFLITNQPVVARNLCDISMIKQIHNKLETLLGREGAYLNDIYFCPHHPDKGYPEENPDLKVDCDCRKPKTGMISKAAKEYNVDIESSWFIGDMTADIQTGKNAGMKTILVRTGRGGEDGKFEVNPDHIFDNIEDAVDFILSKKEISS
ncbi:MAG: HAD-IIIA family hydrolase [Thermodesulfovibrionales bacterium]